MLVMITGESLATININPETVVDEVMQNVAALALTPRGSVPLLRGMGMPMDFKDRPMAIAAEIYEAEMQSVMDSYEPRAALLQAKGRPNELAGWLAETLEVEING